MKPNMTPLEDDEQESVFQWANIFETRYPELRWLHAIPNGGSRNPIEAAKLKRMGVKAGVPDIELPVAKGGYTGLHIELKRMEGGRVSLLQKEWIEGLSELGRLAAVCKGAREAIPLIEKYLRGEINRE